MADPAVAVHRDRRQADGITRLGEPQVVWCDSQGKVLVQIDRCPHRAVPLSRGLHEDGRLRSNYHGIEPSRQRTKAQICSKAPR